MRWTWRVGTFRAKFMVMPKLPPGPLHALLHLCIGAGAHAFGRIGRRAGRGALVALLCALPALAYAFDSLFTRVRLDQSLAALFPDSETRADVQDGFLIGEGSERIRHLPDGRLSIERRRRYTAVRRSDTQAVAKLPEPWTGSSSVLLDANLRLIRADTRYGFKSSGDAVFADYKLSEKHAWLFETDRSLIKATDQGRRLQRQEMKQGKVIKDSRYDYPANSAPLEAITLYLSVAVARGIDRFDFELLVPDGGTHGVRSQVVRTRNVARFAEGYQLPRERLQSTEPLAVVDMRLASPVKYLFYPHHLYMAFDVDHPDQMLMMWGGNPDSSHVLAFRKP